MKRMIQILIPLLVALFVSFTNIELASATSDVKTLPLNGQIRGELTKGDESQTYELTLSEAGRVTFNLTSSIDSYGTFQLADFNGNSIFYTYIKGSAQNPGRTVYVRDLEKGTYRLNVSNDTGNGDLGTYAIQTIFKAAATDDIEPNNGTAEAQTLKLGKKTKGYLSTQDTVDVYGIKLTKAGRLSIDLSSYISSYTMIQLTDAYNEQVYKTYLKGASNNPGKFFHQVDLEAGQYYLRIYDEVGNDDTGVYEIEAKFMPALNTEVEPNNGSAEAKALPFYKTQHGFLSWNDPIDVYKLVLPKSSKIDIDLTSYISSYTNVNIYDDSNNLILGKYISGGWKQPGRLKENLVLKKGTYYLHIYENTGKYQVKVNSSHLLPTVVVNKVTGHSTKVTGKTEKGAAVTMTIGKKSYKRTADAKGNYSFSISKQKVGTRIKISSKNKYGATVKTINVTK